MGIDAGTCGAAIPAVERDERGQSISVLVVVVLVALFLTVGLVVDGGQKITATARAESTAAGAARAAGMPPPRVRSSVGLMWARRELRRGPTSRQAPG